MNHIEKVENAPGSISGDPYPDADFPWTFYFNGVPMPKWGACWSLAGLVRMLDEKKGWDCAVGHGDVYAVSCRINHVGNAESADPGEFLYVLQEVLCLLLTRRKSALRSIRSSRPRLGCEAEEVYDGIITAALRMRRLLLEQGKAFWTSGYEADRLRLVSAMARASLPTSDPLYEPPSHVRNRASEVRLEIEMQADKLRRLARGARMGLDDLSGV